MSGSDWVSLVAIVVLFVVTMVLALAETSFTRMTRVKALALEEDGERGAGRLVRMLDEEAETVSVVLLLAQIAQQGISFLLGVLVAQLGGLWLGVAAFALNNVVLFVIGEVAPKTYAIQHTDRAVLRVTPLLWFLTRLWPLRVLTRALIGLANVILPGKGLPSGPYVTEEEIRTMADVAAEEAVIEADERRLIHSVFEFGDTIVSEVMRPRTDMIGVDDDATVAHALEVAIEHGYSRLPVYGQTTDDIVGFAFVKDMARALHAGDGEQPMRAVVRQAVYVPEGKRVAELLREMQKEKFHIAIVVDEYGGTAGLVTMEDLLEEIVGEITDEYDVEEPGLERLADDLLRAPGRTPIDDVCEELGVQLPDLEWDTVGGLVFNTLGHVPVEGECTTFHGLELCAERVEGTRIASVLIRVLEREPQDQPVDT